MRLIIDEAIDIPASAYGCRVYAATYSPDGEVLAYGGGGWYGDGFLYCRWQDGYKIILDRISLRQQVAITGLAFDTGGTILAASTRGPSMRPGPLLLFRLRERTLDYIRTIPIQAVFIMGLGFVENGLAVLGRMQTPPATNVLKIEEAAPGPGPLHLTSCGMARLGSMLVGAAGPHLDFNPCNGEPGFVATLPYPMRIVAADASGRTMVTAVGKTLFWWQIDDDGTPRGTGHMVNIDQDRAFETPQVGSGLSIESLCFIGDTPTVAVANRAGYISLWENGEDRGHWWLPDGSPRCMACHPRLRRLVIGCKGTVHPEAEIAKMLSHEKPIDPKTQSVREGRLLVYELE